MSGRPAPRPKRGGEEFARNHYHENGTSPKKPRFDTRNPSALVPDAPEEDVVLDADEIGKRGQQTKRNAVNIDGYESDSSNEGFDARAEAKAKQAKASNGAAKSKDEEEGDMFADLEDDYADGDENEDKDGKKKKNVKFVDVDEIEGQVGGSKSGGHVSANLFLHQSGNREAEAEAESSSESDVGDEARAGIDSDMDEELGAGSKKQHAPKLEAFNLKAEKEEGGFDEQLNYVRKAADPDAVHDTWLEDVSKKDMKRAREAQDKQDQERRQRALEDDSVLTSDLLRKLIPRLEVGETILEALARLGRSKDKKRAKWQTKSRNRRTQDMDLDSSPPATIKQDDPAETKRRATVEEITGAADQMLTRGHMEIYDTDRELLVRLYGRETGEAWVDAPKESSADEEESRRWEYRWSDARDGGGGVHGPFDSATMVAWNTAGYFGEGVEFRVVGEGPPGEWRGDVEF